MENNSIKYIVYCTTCIVNKKIYIGVHKTNPEYFDHYIGNGIYTTKPNTYERSKTAFQYAVKKYGPKNFIRSTIAIFDNEEDAYSLEEDIVNEDFLARDDVYNMVLGGRIGLMVSSSIPLYLYNKEGVFIGEYTSISEASRAVGRNNKTLYSAIRKKCKAADYYWTVQKFDKLDLSKMYSYEEKNKIPVFQYDEQTGEYDCCYESIRDASRVIGAHSATLSRSIKLGTPYYGKYYTSVYTPTYSTARNKQIISLPVYQYDLDGNYIACYENQQQARKALNIKSNIYNAIKLKQTCGGYQWSFENLPKLAPIKPKAGRPRPIGKYDKDWNLIKTYSTLSSAQKENGSGITHVLRGRNQFSKGFRYKYLDLIEDIV